MIRKLTMCVILEPKHQDTFQWCGAVNAIVGCLDKVAFFFGVLRAEHVFPWLLETALPWPGGFAVSCLFRFLGGAMKGHTAMARVWKGFVDGVKRMWASAMASVVGVSLPPVEDITDNRGVASQDPEDFARSSGSDPTSPVEQVAHREGFSNRNQ